MNDGYLIVEPPSLAPLFGNPKCFDLAIIVLHLLAEEVTSHMGAASVTVEVIKVEYMGSYPALGIRGQALPDDIVERIEKIASDLLEGSFLKKLTTHAVGAGIDWRKFVDGLLKEKEE